MNNQLLDRILLLWNAQFGNPMWTHAKLIGMIILNKSAYYDILKLISDRNITLDCQLAKNLIRIILELKDERERWSECAPRIGLKVPSTNTRRDSNEDIPIITNNDNNIILNKTDHDESVAYSSSSDTSLVDLYSVKKENINEDGYTIVEPIETRWMERNKGRKESDMYNSIEHMRDKHISPDDSDDSDCHYTDDLLMNPMGSIVPSFLQLNPDYPYEEHYGLPCITVRDMNIYSCRYLETYWYSPYIYSKIFNNEIITHEYPGTHCIYFNNNWIYFGNKGIVVTNDVCRIFEDIKKDVKELFDEDAGTIYMNPEDTRMYK